MNVNIALKTATFLLLEDEVDEPEKKRQRKQRSCWMRPLFLDGNGFYVCLRTQLQNNDPELFKNFLRMTFEDFAFLLEKIEPLIKKKETNMRKPISAGERLAITLRFLATGDSYSTLMYLFKRSKASICGIVGEVCDAIYATLKQDFLKMPSTPEYWLNIAKEFEDRWNFPHCIGAIDGKHVDIIAPAKAGSEYYNYKKKNSLVLMALVDAQYNIIYFDIGAKGRESDGGVFARCSLSEALEKKNLNLPTPIPLHPDRKNVVPYLMVADDAFPLKMNIMKPFNFRSQTTAERIFSYRLSRARRVSENVFGIMAARFRILRKPMEMTPEKVMKVVPAICSLHNFLNKRKTVYATVNDYDCPNADGSISSGTWQAELSERERLRQLQPLQNIGRCSNKAKVIREELKAYFLEHGDIPWQHKFI